MTKHPGSENLIPAKKGEVRNPKGKGKGIRNKKTIFSEFLDNPGGDINGKPATNFEIIVANWIDKAKKGKSERAVIDILDRALDKAKQSFDHSTLGEKIGDTKVIFVDGSKNT